MRYFEFMTEAKSPAAKQEIIAKFGEQLAARIKQDNHTNDISVEDLISHIENADPTQKSIYVDWIIREYLKNNIRNIEDIGKAMKFLPLYDKMKPKLPVEYRNVNSFDFNGLWDYVQGIGSTVDARSNKEKKNDLELSLIQSGQAVIIHNDSDWKVVEIHSEEASKFYGKNTKWCTIATHYENDFDSYYEHGPLYIVIEKKNNNRWQYQPASREFKNEDDTPFVANDYNYEFTYEFLETAPKFPDIVIPQNVKDFCMDQNTPLNAEGVEFFKTYYDLNYYDFKFEDPTLAVT